MVGQAYLANDTHSKQDQGLMGVFRHPSVRKRVVRANVDGLLPFSPTLPSSHQFSAVALMAGLEVLSLAFPATVLHNLAFAALLQEGRIRLHPVVSIAVGA